MTYDPNTPNDSDSPANQQPQIKTNFAQLASIFSSTSGGVVYNHSAFNTGNQGKHEAIILEDQVTDPDVENDLVSIYNKGGQIFSRVLQFLPNAIPNFPTQLTYGTVNTAGPDYQSFLPGGYILYIGTATVASQKTLSPACSELLMVIGTPNNGTTVLDVGATIVQPNKFTLNSTLAPGAYVFSYIAIGKQ
jgi:hypothetical protein